MAQDFSKKFYKSKPWRTFREIIINERGNKCQECGQIITESKFLQIHHIEELTPTNIDDTSITLNPDNVMVVCQTCHNKIHNRWSKGAIRKKKPRGIYIVYGPPMSGKTSYVKENMTAGDIVVDMDRLYQAVTLLPMYDKPDSLKFNVMSIRNKILEDIRLRYGKFNSAWIIGGYADKYKREKLARDLGAEVIHIKLDQDDCLHRLKYCNDYRQEHQEEWSRYINDWFEKYSE